MENSSTFKHAYSWHQSHDQAIVLLLVPYDTPHDDVVVVIESNYLLAGVKGQEPIVKGQLYGHVDAANSAWQLQNRSTLSQPGADPHSLSHARTETHAKVHTPTQTQFHTQDRPLGRERTVSELSTTSTRSSYALVSDQEISSSFAASLELESAPVSDAEDASMLPSPALSSPAEDERAPFVHQPLHNAAGSTGAAEGTGANWASSTNGVQGRVPLAAQPHALSSFSSLESLPAPAERLLTIHLEKDKWIIWPSLIVGCVPEEMSACASLPMEYDPAKEVKYNMDPTSLVLIAIEFLDIRKDRDEAFECFVRAWHRAHLPVATMKLVTHYLPLHTSLTTLSEDGTPTRGTTSYHVQSIGGRDGLARLFLEAGRLHLEGAASTLLTSSSTASSLSSLRAPPQHPPAQNTAEAWRRDRDAAARYFERARGLNSELTVPVISDEVDPQGSVSELEMPSMNLERDVGSEGGLSASDYSQRRVRRRVPQQRTKKNRDEMLFVDNVNGRKHELDSAWYVYVPSLVGAGTALLVVGVIGALSFSSWRRNQGP